MCSINIVEKILFEVLADLVDDSCFPSSGFTQDSHPLPCSADFQFFVNIAATNPMFSPDEESTFDSIIDGVTPPVSPLTPSYPSPVTPLSSPGVPLIPLSGAVTQARFQQVSDSSIDAESFESPPKRLKLDFNSELDEEIDDEEELDMKCVDRQAGMSVVSDEESDNALPLTFNSPVDLLWKLKKAKLIPSADDVCSQRPGSKVSINVNAVADESGGCHDLAYETENLVPTLTSSRGHMAIEKDETQDLLENRSASRKMFDVVGNSGFTSSARKKQNLEICLSREVSLDIKDEGKTLHNDCNVLPVSCSNMPLLHKAPRIGLSKLYRNRPSLHDISIVEEMKTKVFKEEIIYEKEE